MSPIAVGNESVPGFLSRALVNALHNEPQTISPATVSQLNCSANLRRAASPEQSRSSRTSLQFGKLRTDRLPMTIWSSFEHMRRAICAVEFCYADVAPHNQFTDHNSNVAIHTRPAILNFQC